MGSANVFRSSCLCLSLCLAPAVQAKDCADEPGGAAVSACFAARYQTADAELNRVYKAALNDLLPDERKTFMEAQRAWVRYRDAGLAFMLEANKNARSYGAIVVGNYKAAVVEKRVQELKFITASPADPVVPW